MSPPLAGCRKRDKSELMKESPKLEVFHDGGCPVCCLEIDFYDRLDKSGRIRWTDILDIPEKDLPAGKSRETLLGKFHVRDLPPSEGSDWHIGIDAFSRIWRELPGFRYFAWLFRVPLLRQLAHSAYLGFLRWQAWHRSSRRSRIPVTGSRSRQG